jgi:hypothetical protein
MGRIIAEALGLSVRQHVDLGLNEEDRAVLRAAIARARRRLEAEGTLQNELEAQREIRELLDAA